MDRINTSAFDVATEESNMADRMRMDSFRLGKGLPSTVRNNTSKPPHARSRSRNSSISISLSLPATLNSLPSTTTTTTIDTPPSSPTRSSIGGSKRNSHHRRRSSVSTRRESADMMGVSLPSIATSSADDNINLGDKDSIRRRALWALEGKGEVGSFSKVEIPEFDAPASNRTFELPTKPSFPPGIGAGFGSKRDSFGKFMASASMKDHLHTLIEEEEEEEEEEEPLVSSPDVESPVQDSEVQTPVALKVTMPSPVPVRPRPASLNLRPLSLVSVGAVQAPNGMLPTPTLTPSPRAGLKPLTLTASPDLSVSPIAALPTSANKRQSFILSSSPSPTPTRKPSLSLATESTPLSITPSKRSSISYVSSQYDTPPPSTGLPTPEMTPTSSYDQRRSSVSSIATDVDQLSIRSRPLSLSEQHFLFQAHATLVQRITELERVLSARSPRSRPLSCASDTSSVASAPGTSTSRLSQGLSDAANDEMFQLVADLKAERDELKRDVDGWRVRVGDLDRHMGLLAKRVETERRDAWVARERLSLLDVEKRALEKSLEEKAAAAKEALEQLEAARAAKEEKEAECLRLKDEVERMRAVEQECAMLKDALEAEQAKRQELERELEGAGLLATPRAFDSFDQPLPPAVARSKMFTRSRGLGFRSIDSEGSFTDVESVGSPVVKEFGLKAVREEDEDEVYSESDRDTELARYEDEEDCDAYAFPCSDDDNSSLGSLSQFNLNLPNSHFHSGEDEQTPALSATSQSRSPSVSPSSISSPLPPIQENHSRNPSLSKWTFPAGSSAASVLNREPEEVDRFFGCLEDMDNSPPLDSRLRSADSGKTMFAQALVDDEDELPPFVLPADVGVEVEVEAEEPKRVLDVVVEEDEEEEEEDEEQFKDADDEFVGEVDEGGIKFTFNPPPIEYEASFDSAADSSMSSTVEAADLSDPFDEDEEDAVPFTFPQQRSQQNHFSTSSIPRLPPAPVKPSSIPVASPSSIKKPFVFITPPSKRGGATPTFIPQPPRSPVESPIKAPFTPKSQAASFIPQRRSYAKPSSIPVMSPTTSGPDVSPRNSQRVTSDPPSPSQAMKSHVHAQVESTLYASPPPVHTPELPVAPSTLRSNRLSFQTLTNLIPLPSLPWSPRPSVVASTAAAAAAFCFSSDTPHSSMSIPALEYSGASSSFVNTSIIRSPPAAAKQAGYVAKEKQLERLRLRMEEERRTKAQSAAGAERVKPPAGVLHV